MTCYRRVQEGDGAVRIRPHVWLQFLAGGEKNGGQANSGVDLGTEWLVGPYREELEDEWEAGAPG